MDAQRIVARRAVIGLPKDGLTPAFERDFAQYPPAGVIIFSRDFRDLDDLRRLTSRLRTLAGQKRLFLTLDEEGGWVSQLAGHLVVPPNAALLARGAMPGDIGYVASVTARRLRALGFEWDFAPVADVHSEIDNPVIGPRAYGTDPALVAAAVREIVRAFRDAGVASCLKHFPGHGDTRLDSHLTLPAIDADEALLQARELVPFRANQDADSVMTAHVIVRALDAARPATFSPRIVHTLLRETLGYRGIAITDALEMKGASGERGEGEAGRLALEAGCDLLLFAHWNEDVRRARLAIADAIVDGPFDRTYLDLSRPRLAAFDAARSAPSPAELAVPLESLTPPDWESRLEAIVTRGLLVDGALPAAAAQGGWRVSEAEYKHGGSLAADLAAHGVPDGGAAPTAQVIAVSSRVPLPAAAIADLRARAAQLPTVLLGLQSDAFLAQVPEAALRVSASDQTPLTRRVVAKALAELRAKAAAGG